MERTPKTRKKGFLSVKKTEQVISPDHSTPEASTSRNVQDRISSERFSPIDSPGRYDHSSQEYQVYWGWKSPDDVSYKKSGLRSGTTLKTDITPKAKYSKKYFSPKPKRKLIHKNHSDKLRTLADELKSFTEEMGTVPEKSSKDENIKVNVEKACEPVAEKDCDAVTEEVSNISKTVTEEVCDTAEEELCNVAAEKVHEPAPQDCLVVELTPGGLTSLKSFPVNYQFPKVPKLDLEKDIDSSDFVILMEDNSIEYEMIKCTQQIEEKFLSQKPVISSEKGKPLVGPSESDSTMTNALIKFTDYITSPKSITNASRLTKSPVLNRQHPSGRKCVPSPKNGPNSKSLARPDMTVSWDSSCELGSVKKLGSGADEEVMCMLADDSFDNIMLELVVEGEQTVQPPSVCHGKERNSMNNASDKTSKGTFKTGGDSRTEDSFGMLEDDSLIQPDILNFLDTVESQAIAASQPLKCTPEEIQQKMMEAKKKLAVGKRKRKSQTGIVGMHPRIAVISNGQVNR